MCVFEVDEPCTIYTITHPRCRKPAPCRVCRLEIAKGEEYERHSYVFDGTARSDRLCVTCALAHLAFRDDPHHRGSPTPDWFFSALRECFDGALKTEPDTRIWRQLYAAILWRRRRSVRAEA